MSLGAASALHGRLGRARGIFLWMDRSKNTNGVPSKDYREFGLPQSPGGELNRRIESRHG